MNKAPAAKSKSSKRAKPSAVSVVVKAAKKVVKAVEQKFSSSRPIRSKAGAVKKPSVAKAAASKSVAKAMKPKTVEKQSSKAMDSWGRGGLPK